MFGIDLNFIITVAIVIIFVGMILKFLRGMTVNIKKTTARKKLDPTTTGERLKKYLIQAVKLNPKTAKLLYLERTKYSEGGKVGKIVGHLTDRECTTFIIKKSIIGRKQLVYCPINMHTSLHSKTVLLHGSSLHSAGGYLWVVPTPDGISTNKVFLITSRAFEKDLRRMMAFDVPQIEVEQIYEGITGFDRDESFYDEDEGIEERYSKEDDDYEE